MRSDDGVTLPTSGNVPELNIDCFDCAPEYDSLREAIAADDWAGFDAAVRSRSTDDTTRALFHLGEHESDLFRDFALAHADEPAAKVAIAYRELETSWRIQSTALPAHMGPRLFAEARRAATRAESHLVDACAIDPGFVAAWTARVLSARILGVSLSEARRRYDRVQALGGDFWASMHMHQYLEASWFGSVEAARAFIDSAMADAPEGSLNGILVALFHLERCHALDGPKAAQAYLTSDGVQEDLDAAAQRSVWNSSQSTLTTTVIYGHQLFLAAYWLSGEKAKAARHRQAMGNRSSSEHWTLLSTDEASTLAVWRELGTVAGVAA